MLAMPIHATTIALLVFFCGVASALHQGGAEYAVRTWSDTSVDVAFLLSYLICPRPRLPSPLESSRRYSDHNYIMP